MSEGIMITTAGDDIKIVKVNDAVCKITGYTEKELSGKNPNILHSGWQNKEFYKKMWKDILTKGYWEGELWNRTKNGELYVQYKRILALKDSVGNIINYIGIVNEITNEIETQKKIHVLSYYDVLTNLPNRYLFIDRLSEAIERTKFTNEKVAVLLIDLDRFNVINRTFSHHTGDILLKKVAKRLENLNSKKLTFSRLSSDEFGIMIENTSNLEEVINTCEKILNTLSKSFKLKGNEIFISGSIGISIYPFDGKNTGELLKNASVALSNAKNLGKNTYRFYRANMNKNAIEKLKVENNLRHAIERKELYLVYQPQIDIQENKLVGVEALVRWKNSELGYISPSEFIPMAEEIGFIIPLGEWIIKTACNQYNSWKNINLRSFKMSINLSPLQFKQKHLIQMIQRIINEEKFNEKDLELEITEGAVMENVQECIEILQNLKSMGITIAMDDFGTGYSSLQYLKQFPINKLKIDRSFIINMTTNQQDAVIAETIIYMAHTLNLKVIAEGVETDKQLKFLIEKGCDEVQGYYFSKPLLTEEIEKFITEFNKQ